MDTALRNGLNAAVVAAGVITILTLGLSSRFVAFELITNFQLQFFFGSLLATAGLILLRLWRQATAIGAIAIVLGAGVVPYLTANGTDVPDDVVPITFLQYNILYTNEDIDAIAQVVLDADADVVALHELTIAQWEPLQPLLAERYPHQLVLAHDPNSEAVSRGGGKAILSAAPLTNVAFDLPVEFTPPLAATTLIGGRQTLVVALHPSPSRTGPRRIYHRQAKLRAVTELAANYDGPAVIITDLNIAPTSPDYESFLNELGWNDPRRTVGITPTYFVGGRRLASVAIDHVFVSPEFTVHDYDVGPRGGSDHLSLVATVSWNTETRP